MSDASPILIKKFFESYCKFWQSDLEEALIEGRTFSLIDLFKVNLALLISDTTTFTATKKSLDNLALAIEKHRSYLNGINIVNCHDGIRWVDQLSRIMDDEIVWYLARFIYSYDFVSTKLKIDHTSRKIQDLLVEFNNALSHLITTCQSHENLEVNKKRAISHLHRGILDSYKEVIHANKDLIRADTQIYKSLGDKTIYDYYIDTRSKEASDIGSYENKKSYIIKRFSKIAHVIS